MPFECYPVVPCSVHVFTVHPTLIAALKAVKTESSLLLVYAWHIPCIYLVYAMYIQGIFEMQIRVTIPLLNHSFLQHEIVLNHCFGLQHRLAHKSMKITFRYPLYIPGIYQIYIASRNIHGISMYIPTIY